MRVYKAEWWDAVAWSWQRAYVLAIGIEYARDKIIEAGGCIHKHRVLGVEEDSFRVEAMPDVFMMDEIDTPSIENNNNDD